MCLTAARISDRRTVGLPYSIGDISMRMIEKDEVLRHCLVGGEGGMYILKNVNGDTLSVIHTRDERMAAWCAWYYLMGMQKGALDSRTTWRDRAKRIWVALRIDLLDGVILSIRPS